MGIRLPTGVATALSLLAALPLPATARPLPEAPGCRLFPADNAWNQRVDGLPRAAGSATLVARMAIPHLHPDFGTAYGIPYNVVGATTPRTTVRFDYADESDAGPYPIPAAPKQEDGSDAHVLVVDRDACRLYELFAAHRGAGGWTAGSGAIWDMNANAVRPAGWTSADAAGLPILPGLARYDEVAAGSIDHALRFTLSRTQAAYVYPARHRASSLTDPAAAPMGLRLRLRASYPLAGFGGQARVVLTALKRYGMIVADNGSSGYITGAPSPSWDDDGLHALGRVPGSAFEVVDTTGLTGTPPGRVFNGSVTVRRGRAVAHLFLTADRAVTLEARRSGHPVAHRTVRARQGYVVVSMRAVSGVRYRIRLG
jgi:hypothetical protein